MLNSKLLLLHFEAFHPLSFALVNMASSDSSSSLSPLTPETKVYLETSVEALFGTPCMGGTLPLTPLVVAYLVEGETNGAVVRPNRGSSSLHPPKRARPHQLASETLGRGAFSSLAHRVPLVSVEANKRP